MSAHTTTTLPQTTQAEDGSAQIQRSSHPRPSSVIGSTVPGVRSPVSRTVYSRTITMSPEALQNNERLFPMFKAQLSEDRVDGVYTSSAEKLAGWLNNDRAYYPAARPWIVTLIETAQQTIRRIAGNTLPQNQPFHVSQCPSFLTEQWVDPYINLIRIVRRYDRLFVEPDLRARLEALLQTIDAPQVPTVHAPAPLLPKDRSASAARTPTTALPAPYAVSPPAPMPASVRHVPSDSSSPVEYHPAPHHTVSPSMTVPTLNVAIPPAILSYQHHVVSPATTSPFAALSTSPVAQPAALSRPASRPGSSSSSTFTMPPRPSSASSHTVPLIVSAPVSLGVASPATSTPSMPDLSTYAFVKRKKKKKRSWTNDYMMDDVEWFREKREREEQARQDANLAAKQLASAMTSGSSELEPGKGTAVETKVERPTEDSPAVLGPGPIDQPADNRPVNTDQDVQMADATAAMTEALQQADSMAVDPVNEPPNEIPVQVEPELILVPQSPPISDATGSTKEDETATASAGIGVGDGAAVELPPSIPSTAARILDLSKLSSQAAAKAKKMSSSNLVYSKVAQPAESVSDKPDPSIVSATAIESQNNPPSDGPLSLAATHNDVDMGEGSSHIVESPESTKGPPGIKASEFAAQIQAPTTPPGAGSSRAGITLHSKKDPGLKLKLLPPKPPSSSSKETSTAPTASVTLSAEDASTPQTGISSAQHTDNIVEQGINTPSPTPQSATPPTSVAKVGPRAPVTTKPDSGSDTQEDEPLSARKRRVSRQHKPLTLKRTRSQSPDTPLAQRRKNTQGTPVATPMPSCGPPLAVWTQPREYTVEAFASGSFVYSPVQPRAPSTVSEINMDVDEREDSPVVLPPSLTRAPASGKPKKPVRMVEDMGLGVEPFADKELQKMPIFRDGSRILAFGRGKPFDDTTPLTLSFSLEQEEYDACSLWSRQNDHKQLMNDLSFFKCLSLCCYDFVQVDRKRQALNNPSLEEVFAGRPNDFPWHRCVQLRIEGQDPPSFEVTWAHLFNNTQDQLIDLSKRARPGANNIELRAGKSYVDHSHYVFVLRLHPLTPRQAAWWWERKRNQVTWEESLRRVSRIEVPPIDLGRYTKRAEAMHV